MEITIETLAYRNLRNTFSAGIRIYTGKQYETLCPIRNTRKTQRGAQDLALSCAKTRAEMLRACGNTVVVIGF